VDDAADAEAIVTEVAVPSPVTRGARSELLSGCRGRAERAERALAMLVEATGAVRGYLYLVAGNALVLEAPLVGREPPAAVADRLTELVEAALHGDHVTVPDSFHSYAGGAPQRFLPVLLETTRSGSRIVIGAAALVGSDAQPPPPDAALVEALARELVDAGDVSAQSFR
jgi:hypothetical protein